MSESQKKTRKIPTTTLPERFRGAFGLRVKELRAILGLSQAEMSRLLGRKHNDAVSRIERGENALVPFEVLGGLIELAAQAGYGADWLFVDPLQGAAGMVRADSGPPIKATRILRPGYELAPAEALPADWRGSWVPVIGRIAAGAGIDTMEAESHPAGLADTYVRWSGRCERPIAVRVVGDSMMPVFRPEDIVICDGEGRVEGGVCCVVYEDSSGERLARLKRLKKRGKTAVLESLNSAFTPVEIDAALVLAAMPIVDHLPFVLTE